MPHDASGTIIDGTIDGNKMIKKVLDLSADISTLKVIRYGILALQLLPENSSAGKNIFDYIFLNELCNKYLLLLFYSF